MNPGGVVLVLAGVWLGCQVFGGNMLERLGIITATPSSTGSSKPSSYTAPSTGSTLPA